MAEKNIKEALAEPFAYKDVEFRIQSAGYNTISQKPWGIVLCYITARAVQDRLDEVFGVAGWSSKMIPVNFSNEQGFLCELDCTIDNETISRSDGAPFTAIEHFKGGISDAMKRTAVQLGIGRYLYNLKDMWALFHDKGIYRCKIKVNGKDQWFKWYPPKLPIWALPKLDPKQPEYEKNVFNKDIKPAVQPLESADQLPDSEKEIISKLANMISNDFDKKVTKMLKKDEINAVNVNDYVTKIILNLYENKTDFNEWMKNKAFEKTVLFLKKYEIKLPGVTK